MPAEIRIDMPRILIGAQPEDGYLRDHLCVACRNPYRPAIDDVLLVPLMPPRSREGK